MQSFHNDAFVSIQSQPLLEKVKYTHNNCRRNNSYKWLTCDTSIPTCDVEQTASNINATCSTHFKNCNELMVFTSLTYIQCHIRECISTL